MAGMVYDRGGSSGMELVSMDAFRSPFKSKPNMATQQEEDMRAGRVQTDMDLAALKAEVGELTRMVTEEMSGKMPAPGTRERDNLPKEAVDKIRQLDAKVNASRKKYDSIRMAIADKERKLDGMQDLLDQLVDTNHHLAVGREVTSTLGRGGRGTPSPVPSMIVPGGQDVVEAGVSMYAPTLKSNPTPEELARHLRELANRCEKAILKQHEAEAVGKTYDQILGRLVHMQRDLLPQQEGIRARLESKDEELASEQSAISAASREREKTKAEVQGLREASAASAASWEQRLEDLRAVIEAEEEVKHRAAKRAQMRQELAAKLAGDMSEAEEVMNKRKLIGDLAEDLAGDMARDHSVDIKRVEEAFLRIREVSGLESLDEVVEKLTNAKSLKARLQGAVAEGQETVAKHTAELAESRRLLDDLQYTSDSLHNSRRQVDEMDARVQGSDKGLAKAVATCGRAEQALRQAAIGIQSIATLLQHIPDDAPAPAPDSLEEDLLSCLRRQERILEEVRRYRRDHNRSTAGLEGGELHADHLPLSGEEARIVSGQVAETMATATPVRSRWLEREMSSEGPRGKIKLTDLLEASDDELNGSDDEYEGDDEAVRGREEIKSDARSARPPSNGEPSRKPPGGKAAVSRRGASTPSKGAKGGAGRARRKAKP